MELTPEKFEKAEFTERRRGYDIDQVENFLEETGTEFAQMLAKFRHTEQRAAAAEARLAEGEAKIAEVDRLLAEADERVARAEEAARAARSEAESLRSAAASGAARTADDDAEVERVAKTLVIAQRTADATIAEAKSRAESMLDEARGRADRQMAEAINEAEVIVNDARRRAEEEYAERHAEVLGAVTELEGRRSQIEGVIGELERRLSGYREDLQRTAAELNSLAEDPSAIGPREGISLLPDEVITGESAVVDRSQESTGTTDQVSYQQPAEPADSAASSETREVDDPRSSSTPDDGGSSGTVASQFVGATEAPSEPFSGETVSARASAVGGTGYLDLTSGSGSDPAEQINEGDSWGPGSWSEVEASLEGEPVAARERRSTSTITASAATSTTSAVGGLDQERADVDHVDERPTEAVPRAEVHRDKYLEELDQAVNTPEDSDDEALAAFLDGGVDSKARRFGWRR